MIYPLLIARKENADLLKTTCKKLGIAHEAQKKLLGGNWRLADIIKSLRIYSVQTHFFIDIGAIEEKGDTLVSMLDGIRYQRDDAVIVLFADDMYPGDPILDKLVRSGYHNIVASTDRDNTEHNWQLIFEDIEKCMTDGELPEERFSLYLIPEAEPETEKKKDGKSVPNEEETAQSVYTYRNCNVRLNFYGAAARVGTTSLTIITAQYFHSHGAGVCVVFRSKDDERRFRCYYEIPDSEPELFSLNGIHFTSNPDEGESFPISLYDMGVFNETVSDQGLNILVAALDWMDMLNTYKAQKFLDTSEYILGINHSSLTQFNNARKVMYHPDVPVLLVPYCPDKMTLGEAQTESFDNAFNFLAD